MTDAYGHHTGWVHNHDADGVTTQDGFLWPRRLPEAGFAIIESPTLRAAIAIAFHTPCGVPHGVVEVWPLRALP